MVMDHEVESLNNARKSLFGLFNEVAPHAPVLQADPQLAEFTLRDAWVSTRAFMTLNPNATAADFERRAEQCLQAPKEDAMDVLGSILELRGLEAVAQERGIKAQLPDTTHLRQRLGVSA